MWSFSSASTTNHSPESHIAPVPISLTSPPMMNDGLRPASTSARASIELVVVLPCVPATAMVRRLEAMAGRISPRLTTGTPRSSAARTSGLLSRMADEMATRAASPMLAGSWPMATGTPSARSLATTGPSRRSDPVTWWPMVRSTDAMAPIPAPPAPITWMEVGVERSTELIPRPPSGWGMDTARSSPSGPPRRLPPLVWPAIGLRRPWSRGGQGP